MKSIKLLLLLATALLGCSKPDDPGIDPKDDDPPKEEVTLPYFTDFRDAALSGDSTYLLSKGLQFYSGNYDKDDDCPLISGKFKGTSQIEEYGLIISATTFQANLSQCPEIEKITIHMFDNCSFGDCTIITVCDDNGLVQQLKPDEVTGEKNYILSIGGRKLSTLSIESLEAIIKSISIE